MYTLFSIIHVIKPVYKIYHLCIRTIFLWSLWWFLYTLRFHCTCNVPSSSSCCWVTSVAISARAASSLAWLPLLTRSYPSENMVTASKNSCCCFSCVSRTLPWGVEYKTNRVLQYEDKSYFKFLDGRKLWSLSEYMESV